MEQKRLALYHVDMKYVRDLAHVDNRVMSVSPQINKNTRPFIGIIVICGNKQYCVPFSSPKEKHKTMKNTTDFTRIMDGDKIIGVLNFNSMIPVTQDVIIPIDIRSDPNDSAAVAHYKKLAKKQLTFCQKNQEVIVKKAERLYMLITTDKASNLLKKRCCDFYKLEQILEKR